MAQVTPDEMQAVAKQLSKHDVRLLHLANFMGFLSHVKLGMNVGEFLPTHYPVIQVCIAAYLRECGLTQEQFEAACAETDRVSMTFCNDQGDTGMNKQLEQWAIANRRAYQTLQHGVVWYPNWSVSDSAWSGWCAAIEHAAKELDAEADRLLLSGVLMDGYASDVLRVKATAIRSLAEPAQL